MTTHYNAVQGANANPYNYSDHWNLSNDFLDRIATALENILAKQTLIESHLDRIQSVVEDTTSSCSTGPHFRMFGGGCANEAELTRAMMMANMKATNTLEAVRDEVNNPTPFP